MRSKILRFLNITVTGLRFLSWLLVCVTAAAGTLTNAVSPELNIPTLTVNSNGVPTVSSTNRMVCITNVCCAFTNVAVKTPNGIFENVTLYDNAAINNCTILYWSSVTNDPRVVRYTVSYGKIDGNTNTWTVSASSTIIAFKGVLETNTTYWFYAQSEDAYTNRSSPSETIMVTNR